MKHYKYFTDGVEASKEVLDGKPCTPERKTNIATGHLFMENEMRTMPKNLRTQMTELFEKAEEKCGILESIKEKKTMKKTKEAYGL